MTPEQLARRIADIEYPISGKSSERLNADMVRKITPVIEKAFLQVEVQKDFWKDKSEKLDKLLSRYSR